MCCGVVRSEAVLCEAVWCGVVWTRVLLLLRLALAVVVVVWNQRSWRQRDAANPGTVLVSAHELLYSYSTEPLWLVVVVVVFVVVELVPLHCVDCHPFATSDSVAFSTTHNIINQISRTCIPFSIFFVQFQVIPCWCCDCCCCSGCSYYSCSYCGRSSYFYLCLFVVLCLVSLL